MRAILPADAVKDTAVELSTVEERQRIERDGGTG